MTDKKDENLEAENQEKQETANDEELSVDELKKKYDLSSQEAIRQKNINKAIVSSAKNPEALLEQDEKIVQSVLDQMYDGISLEEYKQKHGLGSDNQEDDKVDIDEIVKKQLNQEKVNEKVEHIRNQLPEDFQSKFDEEFADLTEGKNLDQKSVDKYIKLTISTLKEWDDEGVLNQIRQSSIAGRVSGKKVSEKTKQDEARYNYAKEKFIGGKKKFTMS